MTGYSNEGNLHSGPVFGHIVNVQCYGRSNRGDTARQDADGSRISFCSSRKHRAYSALIFFALWMCEGKVF